MSQYICTIPKFRVKLSPIKLTVSDDCSLLKNASF